MFSAGTLVLMLAFVLGECADCAKAYECPELAPAMERASPLVSNSGSRRALLIVVSDYERGGRVGLAGTKWPSLASGCDAEVIKQVLVNRFGFEDREVVILAEEQATLTNIIQRFQTELIDRATPGDTVVFYFSGHGQRVADPRKPDGLRGTLVPWDYIDQTAQNGAKSNLRSDRLGELLEQLKHKMRSPTDNKFEGNITVILDACFSGGGTKGERQPKGRGWDVVLDGPLPPVESGAVKGHLNGLTELPTAAKDYIFLAAARNDRLALGGTRNLPVSLFTERLAIALGKASSQETYRDVFARLSAELADQQDPQIEGEKDWNLFGFNRANYFPYLIVRRPATATAVTLPVGTVHGATEGSVYAVYRPGALGFHETDRVADVKVKTVLPTTCSAEIVKRYDMRLGGATNLLAGRAIEKIHSYGKEKVRVLMDRRSETLVLGQKPSVVGATAAFDQAEKIMRNLAKASGPVTLRDVNASAYDVALTCEEQADGATLVLRRFNGMIVFQNPVANTGTLAEGLESTLTSEWQWQFFAKWLNSPSSSSAVAIQIRLAPITRNEAGRPRLAPDGRPLVAAGTSGEQPLPVQVGEQLAIELRDPALRPGQTATNYVTVLNLTPEGRVEALFPVGTAPATVELSSEWRALPGFLWEVTLPTGLDFYKAIVSQEPANFGLFLERGARRGGSKNVLQTGWAASEFVIQVRPTN